MTSFKMWIYSGRMSTEGLGAEYTLPHCFMVYWKTHKKNVSARFVQISAFVLCVCVHGAEAASYQHKDLGQWRLWRSGTREEQLELRKWTVQWNKGIQSLQWPRGGQRNRERRQRRGRGDFWRRTVYTFPVSRYWTHSEVKHIILKKHYITVTSGYQ